MHKKALYSLLVALALTLAATASGQEETFYESWKASEGKRGTLKHQDGDCEYIFTLDDAGEQMIARVGRDYVEFARFTREKGERRTHRLVPMSRLVMRRSRLSR
ncbi:MAG TPA: hypothetical protein VEO54_16240 [Thermoanaerobaculia bacterium]|nr:hypothetical protein [Thermoanaerobaculia bacterium]